MTKPIPKTNPSLIVAYQQAIAMLASDEMTHYDFLRRIVVALAQQDPVLFNQLTTAATPASSSAIQAVGEGNLSEFLTAFSAGNRISSIRAVREVYGISLMQAKDIVEAIWNGVSSINNGDYTCLSHLPATSQIIATKLAKCCR